MARSSAAANRGHLRVVALAGAALAVALLPAGGRTASRATPLVQVTPKELRLSQPVLSLAADGGRAAFVFCQQLVGVWRPGAPGIARLGATSLFTCPPSSSPESVVSLALARNRIAWSIDEGGNIVDNIAFLTTLAAPHTLTTVAQIQHCCRGQADQERMGYVLGDGDFLLFGTRQKCGDFPGPPCPSPAPTTFVDHSVWRVRRAPFAGTCVDRPGPCQKLASSTDVLEALSVDAGRVALRRADGSVEVRNAAGAVVRAFPALAGLTRAAELMGNRLVVLVPGRVLELALASGAQLHARPVPQVPSSGVCGITPCLPTTLRLVDAARGLVAYTLSGKLHLLRLRDGRNRVVGAATDARFGDTGLFYARTATGRWPGRIRFVPWAKLPVRP